MTINTTTIDEGYVGYKDYGPGEPEELDKAEKGICVNKIKDEIQARQEKRKHLSTYSFSFRVRLFYNIDETDVNTIRKSIKEISEEITTYLNTKVNTDGLKNVEVQ